MTTVTGSGAIFNLPVKLNLNGVQCTVAVTVNLNFKLNRNVQVYYY